MLWLSSWQMPSKLSLVKLLTDERCLFFINSFEYKKDDCEKVKQAKSELSKKNEELNSKLSTQQANIE